MMNEQDAIKQWNKGFIAGALSNLVVWIVLYKLGWL